MSRTPTRIQGSFELPLDVIRSPWPTTRTNLRPASLTPGNPEITLHIRANTLQLDLLHEITHLNLPQIIPLHNMDDFKIAVGLLAKADRQLQNQWEWFGDCRIGHFLGEEIYNQLIKRLEAIAPGLWRDRAPAFQLFIRAGHDCLKSNLTFSLLAYLLRIALDPLRKDSANAFEAYVWLLFKDPERSVLWNKWIEDIFGPLIDFVIHHYVIGRRSAQTEGGKRVLLFERRSLEEFEQARHHVDPPTTATATPPPTSISMPPPAQLPNRQRKASFLPPAPPSLPQRPSLLPALSPASPARTPFPLPNKPLMLRRQSFNDLQKAEGILGTPMADPARRYSTSTPHRPVIQPILKRQTSNVSISSVASHASGMSNISDSLIENGVYTTVINDSDVSSSSPVEEEGGFQWHMIGSGAPRENSNPSSTFPAASKSRASDGCPVNIGSHFAFQLLQQSLHKESQRHVNCRIRTIKTGGNDVVVQLDGQESYVTLSLRRMDGILNHWVEVSQDDGVHLEVEFSGGLSESCEVSASVTYRVGDLAAVTVPVEHGKMVTKDAVLVPWPVCEHAT